MNNRQRLRRSSREKPWSLHLRSNDDKKASKPIVRQSRTKSKTNRPSPNDSSLRRGTSTNRSVSTENTDSPPRRCRIVFLGSGNDQRLRTFNRMILPLEKLVEAVVTCIYSEDSKDSINFLTKVSGERILLFVKVDGAQSILEQVHPLQHIEAIFLVGETVEIERERSERWTKIRDHSQIDRFVKELSTEKQIRQSRRSCSKQSQSIEILQHVPPSFMLTQLLTEIVVQMKDDDAKAKQEYLAYARHRYRDDAGRLDELKKFEADYSLQRAIHWYTRYPLIYRDLNAALRSGNIREILMMRLIIRYTSRRLKQLYQPPDDKITYYRGQCLCCSDFEQLRLRIGGLYPFNSFISTSLSPDVGHSFAKSTCDDKNPSQATVLFPIHINPHASKWTTFAQIDGESHHGESEEEVLFSTNSIFRIGRINHLGEKMWEVNLHSTTDRDEELQRLSEAIRIASEGSTEWERIGKILFNLGMIDTAKEVLDFMIENMQKDKSSSFGHLEHLMGVREQINDHHPQALTRFRRALEYCQRDSEVTDQAFVNIHRDLGSTYQKLGEYQQAERSFRDAIRRQEQMVPTNYIALLSLYQPLADVLEALGSYSERLKIDEPILDIQRNKVVANELELAETYRCIARSHYQLKNYQLCLENLKKICDLRRPCIEATDPQSCLLQELINALEISGSSIDYESIEKQIEHVRNELEQLQRDRAVNSTALVKCYDALGQLHFQLRDYPTALEWYLMTRRCIQKNPSVRCVSLASTYDRIGQIYDELGNHLEASLSYREAIKIEMKSPSDDTTSLELYRAHLKRVVKLPGFFDDEVYQKANGSNEKRSL